MAEATQEAGQEEMENRFEMDKAKDLPLSILGRDGAPMILNSPGYFTMGSSKKDGNKDEHPSHRVWISSYYIDKYLVTFDRYDKFCEVTGRSKPPDGLLQEGKTPHRGRGQRPVLNLTWGDADSYCKWAGGRLPTEAEWGKAARGGNQTPFFWGMDSGKADDYAWYEGDSRDKTWPVGELKPNPYGLYDIVGNLWEWVSDWYSSGYYSVSSSQIPPGRKKEN